MKAINPRQALSQFVSVDKYSRYIPELRRRETKNEGQTRMMDMHRTKFAGFGLEAEMDEAERFLHDNRVLGSQRAWQFGGDAILNKNARSFNCAFSLFDRPDFLKECVWLLLCGCGTGFSVQKQHVAKLPTLSVRRRTTGFRHYVEDSIEGWANAFDALLNAYFDGDDIEFDYSRIRPEGSAISSTSAKAPGPDRLRRALENCRRVLDAVVGRGGVIRPVDAFDLVMFAAECVRSGGVRRSATIALFSPDDEEMLNSKTGDWFSTNPQRRLANISAAFLRSNPDRAAFDNIFKRTKEFGEPGVVWLNNLDHGFNPCVEAAQDPILVLADLSTLTGWSMCNLTTVNCAVCDKAVEFLNACRVASFLGTLQAAYTVMPYLGWVTEAIIRRDAQLGVSLTGIADKPMLLKLPWLLQEGAKTVNETNEKYAAILGINSAARTTCVKPEGTGSLALGGVASGSTPHHAEEYLRYVEGGKLSSPLVQYLMREAPEAVEVSAYDPDEVKICFPITAPVDALCKKDVSALGHLDLVETLQLNWVRPGTRRSNLEHNVSNTIVVKDHEWVEVADRIFEGRDVFSGVALLGSFGDLDYPQAPFVAVRRGCGDPRAIAVNEKFDRLKASWPVLNFTDIVEDADNASGTEVIACGGGACEI